jgi:hypothetical protein
VVEQDGEQEEIKVHRMLLESRSPFFRGMLESNMAEAQQGRYVVRDMLAPVVKAVLYFIYTGTPWLAAQGAGVMLAGRLGQGPLLGLKQLECVWKGSGHIWRLGLLQAA